MADTAIWCNIHKRSDVGSCQLCDQNNPLYHRFAIIGVEVDRNWLTDNGEYPDTDDGWVELEKQVKETINHKLRSGSYAPVTIRWEEWEGPPEEV